MAAERDIRAGVVRNVRSLCREVFSAVAGRIFFMGHHVVLLRFTLKGPSERYWSVGVLMDM
jgi:hypothetical protein